MPGSRLLSLAILAMLAACASAAPVRTEQRHYAILPGTAVTAMLNQCSRPTPEAGQANWQPTEADVARVEAILPAALAAAPETQGTDFSDLERKWRRQYVGLVRDGRRFLYGNFFPAEAQGESWRNAPTIVCDGGPDFFGVEFDVEGGRITHIAFNGSA